MSEFFSGEIFHLICVALHFGSFIALILFMTVDDIVPTDGKMQLYILKAQTGAQFTEYVMEPWANPSIFAFLAAFSGLTAFAHAYYAYTINTHDSTIRFIEYFFTASIMADVIAILVGIRDIYSIIGIEACIATTMIFGYLEEKTTLSHIIRPYYLGYVPYLAAWTVITWQFIRVAIVNDQLPGFVIGVFATQIFLFSCFGFVQWWYVVLQGKVTNQLEMEGAYNLLSLTSKMLLVWLCAGGIIAQSS